ncbi:heme o synthase [Gammaproteobacteria bacterium]|nr:heme o synthase [Gammaproteobacteria bacterium]
MKANLVVAPPGQVSVLADYQALIKFRLLLLVLISVCMGFFIGINEQTSFSSLLWVLVGVYCVGGGANTLNQWIEREIDILMVRTQKRPLPSKRLTPNNALLFGLAISAVGFIVIAALVNTLTLILSFLSWISYLLIYTPLKRKSSINTWVGALPGALPAALGCTAAAGEVTESAFILFLILFVWQMPHFFAISWIYRKDYLSGGFKMLSWDDDQGTKTAKHILIHAVLLLPVSSSLFLLGHSGLTYFLLTLTASLIFIYYSILFYISPDIRCAKKVFRFSIVYLPILFFAIIFDKVIIYLS